MPYTLLGEHPLGYKLKQNSTGKVFVVPPRVAERLINMQYGPAEVGLSTVPGGPSGPTSLTVERPLSNTQPRLAKELEHENEMLRKDIKGLLKEGTSKPSKVSSAGRAPQTFPESERTLRAASAYPGKLKNWKDKFQQYSASIADAGEPSAIVPPWPRPPWRR